MTGARQCCATSNFLSSWSPSQLGPRLRAATRPHADGAGEATRTWTNGDLERLSRIPGLISIIGLETNKAPKDVTAPALQRTTKGPAWYAAQATSLNAWLEAEQADLRNFAEALDDARELKSTTAGINLAESDIGITPEATITILENRMLETQIKLDALEDLARRNDISPGTLRGR